MQLSITKMHKHFFIFFLILGTFTTNAQEIKARITVVNNRVANNVDKKTFETLQKALEDFVNNQKWTSDAFAAEERIPQR